MTTTDSFQTSSPATLSHYAHQFNVEPTQPYFPVNSLRLLHFLVINHFLPNNNEVIKLAETTLPLIHNILETRTIAKNTHNVTSPLEQYQTCRELLEELFTLVPSQPLRQSFHQVFTHSLPLHDDIMKHLYLQLQLTDSKTVSTTLLAALLKIRATDSILYSTLMIEIIHLNSSVVLPEPVVLQLHSLCHLLYQYNDILDAVIYFPEDSNAETFSLIEIAKHIGDGTATRALFAELLTLLDQDIEPLLSHLQIEPLNLFYQSLTAYSQKK